MTKILAIFLTLSLLSGCRKQGTGGGEGAPAREQSSQPTEHPQPGTLHIESGMLRDLRITTALVEERPGGEGVLVLGELRVNENAYAEVGTPVAARVLGLHATAGQFVSAGQSLATLQSTELGRTRAQLITAEAKLALSQQTLERKRNLAKEKIVSQREVQEAEANASSADAEVKAAEAELRALGVSSNAGEHSDSSQFILRSPLAGSVLDRTAIIGQMADPQHPLFRVGNLTMLWLTVQAFERDAVRLKAGFPARITFAALPGKTFAGRVAVVGKQVDLQSRTIPVRIDVTNDQDLLRPGMSATAWITPGARSQKLLAIPVAAMQRFGDEWVVFIPKSQENFEIRRVGRGRDLAGEIEVLSGLKAGETVVVDGSFLLKAEADKARGEGGEHDH